MIPLGPRLIALAILTVLGASVVYHHGTASSASVEAQTRKQQKKTSPKRKSDIQSRTKTNVSAFGFKHEHHRLPTAKLNCSDCHAIPTRATPDLVAAATKTSIKGYPYHDSCLGCHRTVRPQFFLSSTPVICTVCHTRSSPRLTARDLHTFPKQSITFASEFSTYYSHGSRDHKTATRNCETCHLKDERASIAIPAGASEKPYKPVDGAFKTSPSGHAACFKCHWEEKPTKDDCAGCHLTPAAVSQKKRNLLSPHAMESFDGWPREWTKRFSLKFNHDSKTHVGSECTDCHVNITQRETLDVPKADVPIATCAACHFKTDPNIGKEMFQEDEDDTAAGRNNNSASKEGKHTCTGCHSNLIGSAPPPCSHYLFSDKYLSLEDYSKAAQQIAERCKK